MDKKELANMYNWTGPETYLVTVDDNNKVTGAEAFMIVHEKAIKHRSAAVLVFNSKGELLLQRRSATITYPLLFSISAGGHVEQGSDYEKTARNELAEELGLTTPITYIDTVYIETDHDFTAFYKTVYDGMPKFDPKEIDRMEWVSLTDLKFLVTRFPYLFTDAFLRTYQAVIVRLPAA